MSKLNYKTSKDYKRLKELLDKGYKVVLLWAQPSAGTTINSAGIATFVKHPSSRQFDQYLLGYSSLSRGGFSRFRKVCKFWDFSFIEPNGEE